jgi:hypothetical protein
MFPRFLPHDEVFVFFLHVLNDFFLVITHQFNVRTVVHIVITHPLLNFGELIVTFCDQLVTTVVLLMLIKLVAILLETYPK